MHDYTLTLLKLVNHLLECIIILLNLIYPFGPKNFAQS